MKLKYTKPAFVIERFDLTQSIAAGCSAQDPANPNASIGDPNIWNKSECGWVVGGISVWLEGNKLCGIKRPEYDEYEGFCYNNPNGDNVIFAS